MLIKVVSYVNVCGCVRPFYCTSMILYICPLCLSTVERIFKKRYFGLLTDILCFDCVWIEKKWKRVAMSTIFAFVLTMLDWHRHESRCIISYLMNKSPGPTELVWNLSGKGLKVLVWQALLKESPSNSSFPWVWFGWHRRIPISSSDTKFTT